jgi:FkbM family methyltransferase
MADLRLRAKEVVRKLLPSTPRPHRIRGGALKGARLYTSWHDYPGAILGTTERPLLEWFADNVRPGETWIDIGAHYGYTAIALARLVGQSGRVFAFEPVPCTANCIERTRDLNSLAQITVVPLGLDDGPNQRTRDLSIVRGMADSTVGLTATPGRIRTASLDSIWPTLCGDRAYVHGIKIDVQGMELAVVRGMDRLLQTWSPMLIVEFHRGVDRGEIFRVLKRSGYGTAWTPIDQESPCNVFADDMSYVFRKVPCAS